MKHVSLKYRALKFESIHQINMKLKKNLLSDLEI